MTTSNQKFNTSALFIEIVERKHKLEALRKQERELRKEQLETLKRLTRALNDEHGRDYPDHVAKLVINVDGRKYHPEIDPEDGEVTLSEVAYRDVEVSK